MRCARGTQAGDRDDDSSHLRAAKRIARSAFTFCQQRDATEQGMPHLRAVCEASPFRSAAAEEICKGCTGTYSCLT